MSDLRLAWRQLRQSPAFTVLVVATVALGIGANTAVFSLINGYLRPLPVKDADRLVVLAAQTKGDETGFQYRYSYAALQDFRRDARQFSSLFGFSTHLGGLSADGKTSHLVFEVVTGNYFSGLGLRPSAGRLFLPGEGEKHGEALAMVLGYRFWQERFGGRDVVGKQVRLDGRPASIVGVAPEDFHGLYAGADIEAYLPLNYLAKFESGDVFTTRTIRMLTVLGRLKPGVRMAEAQSALDVLARRMGQEYPATEKDIGVRVIPETQARPLPLRFVADSVPWVRGLVLLLAVLVLLLACMNVANLLLVRATVREREMAIRAALGSGRRRLISQLLTESMLLAAMGAAAGILLGKLGSAGLAASIDLGTDIPVLLDFHFDWRVFANALGCTLATGVLIGLWPAVRASRTQAGAVLHDGGRGSAGPRRQRLRSLLVMGQVAGSLMLLVAAGLFVRSLRNAERVNLGFNADHLVNARLDPRHAGYDRARTIDFYRELKRRVRKIGGVESVSLAFSVPLGYISDGQLVYLEGEPVTQGEQPRAIGYNSVDEGYFATMQIPVVRGRGIEERDTATSPKVLVVNETMAARLWPGREAIGKRVHLGTPDSPLWEVVGVARDSKYLAVFENALPYLYVPQSQSHTNLRVLQVRSRLRPDTLKALLQREILALEPDLPIADLQTMRASLNGAGGFLMFRIGALQAGALGTLGLVLAVIGVYGVVSYGASQRTREIGVRMALGALPADVMRMILRQGAWLVVGGVAVGLMLTAALSRALDRVLMLVSVSDPVTILAVTALLCATTLAACYIPARKAIRVEPMAALRHE